jgi:thermostable 8-oxoguanine DNA glycosylase
MNKEEILQYAESYDKEYFDNWVLPEQELGEKFRKTKQVTKDDLRRVVEWKFMGLPWKNDRLNDVANIDDDELRKRSHIAFTQSETDSDKINALKFYGVGAATISVILTFYNPKEYGVFDRHVWRELFGKESKGEYLWTAENYLKVLTELRRIANQYGVDVRTVEKAIFKKQRDKT